MAQDPRRRQKKLQRKKAKHKKSLAAKRARQNFNPFDRPITAPILECFHTSSVWDEGIGYVLVSRKMPNGQVAFAAFLLDVYCLGVKNAMFDVMFESTFRNEVVERITQEYPAVKITPAHARKLVEGGVAYARSFGLPPHEDYQRARNIFGDIDPAQCEETFTFGKNGKPMFVQGPFDTIADCRRITAAISAHVGPGGGEFVLRLTSSDPRGEAANLLGRDLEFEDEALEDDDESGDDEWEDEDEEDGDDINETTAEQPRHDVKPPQGDWLPWLKPQDGPNG